MMAAPRRHSEAAGARPGLAFAARFLLLFAFLLQSTFVQAHVHAAPLAAPVAAAEATSGLPDEPTHAPDDASSHCFVCWEAAVAGNYAAPPAIVLPLPPQPDDFVSVARASELALGKSSHGWLSRAPPQ